MLTEKVDNYQALSELISSRTGLKLRPEDREACRAAVKSRLKGLKLSTFEEYHQFLISDTTESGSEWKEVAALLTTGETYFFRDKGQLALIRNWILPELIENRRDKRCLRIWSAGCATGEEPYSLAILLDMILPDLKGWDILIVGTDINEESLKKAARGIYSQWSFRMVDKDIQGNYFKKHHDEWAINENIKKMVKFQYGNLIEDGSFSQNPDICNVDIIVCRNVFIYFGKEAVSAVFNNFLKILNEGGYLITGHGELYGLDLSRLRQIMFPEAVIYKKTAELEGGNNLKVEAKGFSKPALPVQEASKIKPLEPKTEIAESSKKGRHTEAVDKAASMLNTCKDDKVYLMAQALANSGDYEKAESICRKAINTNAGSADPYFLLAHIAEARGNIEEAMDLFKKAIYLNPSFIAAYCELGGLYEKGNDILRARKARTTAIELLKSLPSQAPVKPYDITAGELLKYVEYLAGARDAALMPAGPKE